MVDLFFFPLHNSTILNEMATPNPHTYYKLQTIWIRNIICIQCCRRRRTFSTRFKGWRSLIAMLRYSTCSQTLYAIWLTEKNTPKNYHRRLPFDRKIFFTTPSGIVSHTHTHTHKEHPQSIVDGSLYDACTTEYIHCCSASNTGAV